MPEGGGVDPNILNSMDPEMLRQFSQQLNRLPKGQLQRLQAMMQRAMSGKDIASEAAEFEKSLPVEFQSMVQAWGAQAGLAQGDLSAPETASAALDEPMTEEKARELVAQAAASGSISAEKAADLLGSEVGPEAESAPGLQRDSKLGKFWKNLAGKKK